MNDLVGLINRARAWAKDYGFPRNEFVRQLRSSDEFLHGNQSLPNVHRSANQLCDTIAGSIVCNDAKRVLEVGTLFAYSTLHLAEAARIVGGHVTTVDLRVPERKWQGGQVVRDIHLTAEEHARRSGLSDFITFCSGRSEQILCDFVLGEKRFDVVFLDGSHSRYVVMLDIINSLNLLSPGGCMFLDDVSQEIAVKDFHHGGPNSILGNFIASTRYEVVLLSRNTLVIRDTQKPVDR